MVGSVDYDVRPVCIPRSASGKNEKETVAPIRVQSFDLKDVRLLASRFRDNMLRIRHG